MLKISDYFLAPIGASRTYTLGGNPIMTLSTLIDGVENYLPKYKLRQLNGKGEWQCDWLLRESPDGSLIEYGDQYPPKPIDWPRNKASLFYRSGHEIVWSLDDHGTLQPDLLRSSPSQWGSWGTYLCKALTREGDKLQIYMEQRFKVTYRATYYCRKGFGVEAVTYYNDAGDSETIACVGGYVA